MCFQFYTSCNLSYMELFVSQSTPRQLRLTQGTSRQFWPTHSVPAVSSDLQKARPVSSDLYTRYLPSVLTYTQGTCRRFWPTQCTSRQFWPIHRVPEVSSDRHKARPVSSDLHTGYLSSVLTDIRHVPSVLANAQGTCHLFWPTQFTSRQFWPKHKALPVSSHLHKVPAASSVRTSRFVAQQNWIGLRSAKIGFTVCAYLDLIATAYV